MKRLLGLVLLSACGPGAGDLTVSVYGEDFIEQLIPAASSSDDEGLVDGYTIRYSKFLIVLADLTVADRHGEVAATEPKLQVWDVHAPGPHRLATFTDLPAGRWDAVSIAMRRAAGAVAGNASESDVALMNDGGYSIYAAGTADRGDDTYAFAWGFDAETRFVDCVDADEQPGVTIPTGGRAAMQITIHGDHLFYDDLQSEDPSLRFEAIAAADTNEDFEVTLTELAAIDLTSLPSDRYGTGGAPDVNDLRAFEAALTQTFVHFQGEGHCDQRRLDDQR